MSARAGAGAFLPARLPALLPVLVLVPLRCHAHRSPRHPPCPLQPARHLPVWRRPHPVRGLPRGHLPLRQRQPGEQQLHQHPPRLQGLHPELCRPEPGHHGRVCHREPGHPDRGPLGRRLCRQPEDRHRALPHRYRGVPERHRARAHRRRPRHLRRHHRGRQLVQGLRRQHVCLQDRHPQVPALQGGQLPHPHLPCHLPA